MFLFYDETLLFVIVDVENIVENFNVINIVVLLYLDLDFQFKRRKESRESKQDKTNLRTVERKYKLFLNISFVLFGSIFGKFQFRKVEKSIDFEKYERE